MNSLFHKGIARGREDLSEEIIRIAGNDELTNEQILKMVLELVNKRGQFCGYTSQRGY